MLHLLQDDPVSLQGNTSVEDAEQIEQLIAERQQAKAAKDWLRADAIRDQLKAMQVELEDAGDKTMAVCE